MKILIDIAHPAHIHYFRNFAKEYTASGNEVLFTLRNKKIIIELADYYKLNYVIRNGTENSKIKYIVRSILNVYKAAKKFKPDFYMDMGTFVSAPVSKWFNKPHIAFEDTEVAWKARLLFMPFINEIITPESFEKKLGKKQIKINSLMELGYLHPSVYTPDENIYKLLNISPDDKYIIIRFISWEAHHDPKNAGLTTLNKIDLINTLKEKYKIFITSEKNVPDELLEYVFPIHPAYIHDALYFADMFIGEGATMASESAILGTPSFYFNPIFCGCNKEEAKNGILFHYVNYFKMKSDIELAVKNLNFKNEIEAKSIKFVQNKISLTKFLVWFVGNYPKSKRIMQENPDYQYRFK